MYDSSDENDSSASSTPEIRPRTLAPVIQSLSLDSTGTTPPSLNESLSNVETSTTSNQVEHKKTSEKSTLDEQFLLSGLPDDVLLRIISHTGKDLSVQIGVAYKLGALNTRLRHLLKHQFLASLTKFTPQCLKSLSLSDSQRAHNALKSFFQYTTKLGEINLSGCTPYLLSTSVMLQISLTSSTTLRHANLAYCRIDDDVLYPLLNNCIKLKSLSLVSCDGPTGKTFDKKICKSPLQNLDLSFIRSLSSDGLKSIGTLSTIQNLNLKGCDIISTGTLLKLFKFNRSNSLNHHHHHYQHHNNLNDLVPDISHSLTSINLSYCSVKDSGLFKLLSNAPKLKTLVLAEQAVNLWSTGEFTVAGIESLRQRFPHVEILFQT